MKKLPAIWRLSFEIPGGGPWLGVRDNLDFGGGKYDLLTEAMAKLGVRNWIFDPFNRDEQHNDFVTEMLTTHPADSATCSCVLNVIKEPAERQRALQTISDFVRPRGIVLVTVYEGDRSSRGRKTTKGWQANRPLKNYLREIRCVFEDAYLAARGRLILASNPV